MDNVLRDLELIEVAYENENKKAVLTFLDEENGEIREINFNKQKWDEDSFVDDPEKEEQVEEWCKEYFDCTFKELTKAIGVKKDVYVYDGFCSLWESNVTKQFDDDMVGQIFEAECTDVVVGDNGIEIFFEYDEETYKSNMRYAKYVETLKKWFPDPNKKKKVMEKFEKKFNIPVDDHKELVGKTLMVEVKKAMGKFVYSEIKPFPKKKGK